MLDEEYYRQEVLEIVLCGMHVSKHVAELRLSLFIRAALMASERPACLKPFPPCFYDRMTKTQCYPELVKHIELIPELKDITEKTPLPALIWELLHWIFTNPLNIEAITMSEISDYIIDQIREDTKLTDIPYLLDDDHMLFEIIHVKKVFREGKNKSGSFFAYHGTPSENVHSIIHNGINSALGKVGAYRFGTYLSSNLKVAYKYASKHSTNYFGSGMATKSPAKTIRLASSSSSNVTNCSNISTVGNNLVSDSTAVVSSSTSNLGNRSNISSLVNNSLSSSATDSCDNDSLDNTNVDSSNTHNLKNLDKNLVDGSASNSSTNINLENNSLTNSIVDPLNISQRINSAPPPTDISASTNIDNCGTTNDLMRNLTPVALNDLMSRLQNINKAKNAKIIRYIAIVEVVKDSSIKTIHVGGNVKHFVVNNDDLIQLRYLYVFKRDVRVHFE